MRSVLPLATLLMATAACGAPSDPAGGSAVDQREFETPTVSSAPSFGSDAAGSGCGPPPDAADGDAWLCVQESTPDPRAEQERLAALAAQGRGRSEQEAQRAADERLREVVAEDEDHGFSAEDEAQAATGVLPADRGSLLIRTDVTHQSQWEALRGVLQTPSPEGFVPYLTTVEHPRWAGASVEDLAAVAPPNVLLVVADAATLTSPEMPLLVQQVDGGAARELRVAAQVLASVEDNSSLTTMDWDDFAGSADPDGVFRGVH
ncbi:DUF6924 domain-containing protein [Kineococcus sp. SYSU DK003]|uniref:DUF6924 domain-containing protein n=1 Tax=Kineococcus sp. SYSU DK003 TaxID=3383124 RepID=UPI003D7E0141